MVRPRAVAVIGNAPSQVDVPFGQGKVDYGVAFRVCSATGALLRVVNCELVGPDKPLPEGVVPWVSCSSVPHFAVGVHVPGYGDPGRSHDGAPVRLLGC